MPWFSTSPAIGTLELAAAPAGRLARLVDWAAAARAHRVILLVLSIWLLNAFDLALTILAHQQGVLHEQNPLARGMLEGGTWAILLYKVGLVMLGSYPLLKFRGVRITELGALVVLVSYALLAIRWSNCYELYTLTAGECVNYAYCEDLATRSSR
jgi:hypothetical protein